MNPIIFCSKCRTLKKCDVGGGNGILRRHSCFKSYLSEQKAAEESSNEEDDEYDNDDGETSVKFGSEDALICDESGFDGSNSNGSHEESNNENGGAIVNNLLSFEQYGTLLHTIKEFGDICAESGNSLSMDELNSIMPKSMSAIDW